ncbi:TetR/AcrR family transcriptional regulator [Leucobacter sp. CSA2]|uniref:TetR/AcrR family transcriptional regulator n=1 Tax=Leucobacter edaphi TaxID=2796472 RepID=A0A934QED0_9MICO|nr:TetR/AcrR family transcriptional regulator [Leucobacter edaphi]MBK0421824.1 TetR/AcrR family transcriptional regulator [Leucobacter edaphi]
MTDIDARRRGRLDQSVIVDAVLALASDERDSRITFKRLGEALGVDATAMYRHFRNKEELTKAALDRLSGMAVEDARAVPGSWRERLERHMIRNAELSLKYPSVAAEWALVDPGGPGDLASDEHILETLSEGGLQGETLLRAYAAVSGFTLAQSAALAQDALNDGSGVRDGSIPWVTGFGGADLGPYPNVREHRDALLAMNGISVYRAGIQAILDSVERWAHEGAGAAAGE